MGILYTAHVTTTGGRGGRAVSDDKHIDLPMTKPGAGGGSNPEQLFAAGYSACFGSAIEAVARSQKLDAGEVIVTADVSLHQDGQEYSISVVLNVNLPKLDDATAKALVEKAHTVCPYSKATRGNIEVTLNAKGGTKAAA